MRVEISFRNYVIDPNGERNQDNWRLNPRFQNKQSMFKPHQSGDPADEDGIVSPSGGPSYNGPAPQPPHDETATTGEQQQQQQQQQQPTTTTPSTINNATPDQTSSTAATNDTKGDDNKSNEKPKKRSSKCNIQ